jgi:hypothetical protein
VEPERVLNAELMSLCFSSSVKAEEHCDDYCSL